MAVAKPNPIPMASSPYSLLVIGPWKPPPPIPKNLPFQLVSGSQTSMLMVESDIGVSVAVTRQKAGRPVRVIGGLEFGTVKFPVVLSSADVMVVCFSCRNFRLVHGVAAAGMGPTAIVVNKPTAEPTSKSRQFIVLSSLNPFPGDLHHDASCLGIKASANANLALSDIHRMPVLLKLRLPHSTDFGNAKPSTRGSRAPKPVTLARRARE